MSTPGRPKGEFRSAQHGGRPMSTRPFKVLGIQQVAIGGASKERLRTLWVDKLGLEVTGNFVSERENVDEDILAMGRGASKVEVDLMQPLDPDKKPAVHTTPLNHIGLWIDDLPAAVAWLSGRGVRFAPGGIRKGAAGFDICQRYNRSALTCALGPAIANRRGARGAARARSARPPLIADG